LIRLLQRWFEVADFMRPADLTPRWNVAGVMAEMDAFHMRESWALQQRL
jgi:hypothetical protein